MPFRFEREVLCSLPPDTLKSLLFMWARERGYQSARELANTWEFTRSHPIPTQDSASEKTANVRVSVSVDEPSGTARILLAVPDTISDQSAQLEVEIEILVSLIKGAVAAPPTTPHPARKGGLLNGLSRGIAGAWSGYLEARADRIREENARPRSSSTFRSIGCIIGVLLLGFTVAIIALAIVAPQVFRVRGVQTPVTVTLRSGVLTANVVRVQNLSQEYLANVVVSANRPRTRQAEARRLGTLAPGQLFELGGLEWNWVVSSGDTVTVKADGYLPIVFSSDQLGGR